MNIAYLYLGRLSIGSGVHKKMIEQASQWRKAGHNVRFFHASIDNENTFASDSSENVFTTISNIMFYGIKFKKDVEKYADIIYMRYSFICYDVWQLMKKIPTIVEINSNEEKEYRLDWHKSIKSKIKCFWNYFNRKALMSVVRGKVCVTYELAAREKKKNQDIPCVVIPNAIIGDGICRRKKYHEKPLLVFIGSPDQSWHGVDKIIQLARKTIDSLEFVIIGASVDGECIPENVKCCGYLSKAEYFECLMNADIGIGSLALHRNGMDEACPLKVREYLSFGLPIIIAYDDTAFHEKNLSIFEWVLKLPNSENNIASNIAKIEEFSYKNKDKMVDISDCAFMRSHALETERLSFFRKMLNEKNIIHR